MNAVRQFAFPTVATVALWVTVAAVGGPAALTVAVALTAVEVLLSFDNAAVNARLLRALSPRWQFLFLTVGIVIAVFVVRFALPIVIVTVTAGLPPGQVVDLALTKPDVYAAELDAARPAINGFGGMFLLMIAAGYFVDAAKRVHWLGPLERRLAALGERENVVACFALAAAVTIAATMPGDAGARLTVLVSACVGIAAHMALDVFGGAAPTAATAGRVLVGAAAAVMFLRLELLDASFSLDGVIAAFAFTDDVLIIAACLGVGAVWVRSLTVYLLRAGVLDAPSARYLEHGAHWAIAVLGVVMLAGVFGVHPPEWAVAGSGMAVIAAALLSSVRAGRRPALTVSK